MNTHNQKRQSAQNPTQFTSTENNCFRVDNAALLGMGAALERIEAVLVFLGDYVYDPDAWAASPKHAMTLINSAEAELDWLRAVIDEKTKNPD